MVSNTISISDDVRVIDNSHTTGVTNGAGTANPSGAPEFTHVFSGVRHARSLVSFVMFCRSLFVLESFFFWPSYFLPFDLPLLIGPLVSSNLSCFHSF